MFRSQLINDFLLIVLLITISYVSVYLLPNGLRALILIILVFLFIRSKDPVPWVVYFFFILSAPAGLFYHKDSWFLLLTPTVGVPYSFIISLAFLYKALNYKKKKIFWSFKIEIHFFIFMIIFLFIVGFFHEGLSFSTSLLVLRTLPNFFLIFFLATFVNLEVEYHRIKELFFVLVILLFLIQIYEILMNKPLLNGAYFLYKKNGIQRNISGIYFAYFTLLIALPETFMLHKKNVFLSFSALLASSLLIINSATRGWMVAQFLIVFGFLFINRKIGLKIKMYFIVLFSLLIPSYIVFIDKSFKYFSNFGSSMLRFSTIFDIIGGDKSAGGTLSRLTERGPIVMKEFDKNLLFGYGFSDKMMEYYDGHVANQSLLMMSGILGFLLLYFIMYKILSYYIGVIIIIRKNNRFRPFLYSMILGMFGIIIIHASSQQMYGYNMRGDKAILLAFWFLFINFYKKKAFENERTFSNRYYD